MPVGLLAVHDFGLFRMQIHALISPASNGCQAEIHPARAGNERVLAQIATQAGLPSGSVSPWMAICESVVPMPSFHRQGHIVIPTPSIKLDLNVVMARLSSCASQAFFS